MVTRQITADGIVAGDRLNLAGVDFTVTARVHGAWYLDCPHARWVEFELVPSPGLPPAPNGRTVLRLPKDAMITVERPAADTDDGRNASTGSARLDNAS
jgi:hypothetical protein